MAFLGSEAWSLNTAEVISRMFRFYMVFFQQSILQNIHLLYIYITGAINVLTKTPLQLNATLNIFEKKAI